MNIEWKFKTWLKEKRHKTRDFNSERHSKANYKGNVNRKGRVVGCCIFTKS